MPSVSGSSASPPSELRLPQAESARAIRMAAAIPRTAANCRAAPSLGMPNTYIMEPQAVPSGDGARFASITVSGSLALAAVSLVLPFEPVFDAWSWLIWGREVADLDLDTSAGASWKPLPV